MFILRKAELKDANIIFNLSNDPIVRSNSISLSPIEWDEHIRWFTSTLKNPDILFHVVESKEDGTFMGQVRLAKKNEVWEISVSLTNECRGKHLGARVLAAAIESCPDKKFHAVIHTSNVASLKTFKGLGFQEKYTIEKNGRQFKILEYEKE